MTLSRRWPSVLFAACVALIGIVVWSAPPASAASCYGDYCSGKNPYTTTAKDGKLCSAGAYSVANAHPAYDPHLRLDVMWSPRCKSNWARWTGGAPTRLDVVQDTGYNPGGFYYRSGVWNTAMVYSPVRRVRATGCTATAGCIKTAWV